MYTLTLVRTLTLVYTLTLLNTLTPVYTLTLVCTLMLVCTLTLQAKPQPLYMELFLDPEPFLDPGTDSFFSGSFHTQSCVAVGG